MENLHPYIHRTPIKQSATLNKLTGADVYLKLENLQKTGSFKLRGALNKIMKLSDFEGAKGIVAASAGNHAQGVAFAASKRGIRSKIYMPAQTPTAKAIATQSYGAEIVLGGETYQEAFEAAMNERQQKGATFVHAFDDHDVIAGQGTIGLELMQQYNDLQALLVPVGGGGLIAGVALAVKGFNPNIKVIGVQASGAPATYNRFTGTSNYKLQHVQSIADGILVKEPGQVTYPIIHQLVDEMVTVTDEEIAYAIMFMLEREKMLVEGAGAAALAALLCRKVNLVNKRVGTIISGGNMDLSNLPLYKKLSKNIEDVRKIS
ncbi:threonine ammonia-lyase [Sutcliffiella cohnii]|uniref:L-threonine dehydratase catabolic TdcB n=1 Tax=Sutcliffiella cohnii TaxID=33932 RepID=A0A223KLI4_9BACI|nr:threonine ammonia-lyase [Sutcliffiella cohnii]AST90193.1 threonine ammonia-lyase [Sutcliffiella cohnii]